VICGPASGAELDHARRLAYLRRSVMAKTRAQPGARGYARPMGMIQVQLPEQIQQVIDRQVARGRVTSQGEFIIEAARRFAEDIVLEDEIVREAQAGIADAEAGRFVTVATTEDATRMHERAMARLQTGVAADQG